MAEVFYKDWDANLGKDVFKTSDLASRSFAQRSGLGGTEVLGTATSYWDEGAGLEVYASPDDNQNAYFELLKGGGVRRVEGALPSTPGTAKSSSLFNQTYTGTGDQKQQIEGMTQDKLAIQGAEGKEVARTGQTVKNPETGVDVYAPEGKFYVEYSDGTVELRDTANPNKAGEMKAIGETGASAEELGITRRTEVKGGEGAEVTRAPYSASEGLQKLINEGASAEDIDKFIQSEGGASTADFELIGKTYQGRTAGEGMAFFQDPTSRKIVERPEQVSELAQKSTSPTIAAEQADIPTLFKAVFGRNATPEELKYWQGRSKRGGALVGAMQFAKQQGASIGNAPGSGDPVEAIKAQANDGQKQLAQQFTESGITTRSDDKKALRAEISMEPPKSESLKEFTEDQLAATEFQQAQNDLNMAKNALRQMDTDYINQIVEAERTPGLSMGAIRRNQGELDIAYQRARRDLQVEVQMYTDIVQSQLAITGMMIDAFKFDQQTAQQDYQNRFNRATTLYNMIRQDEQDEFNMQQKLQDNQRANLSVITSMLQSGNLKFDQLTGDQKAQIAYMEQSVGLPAGFTSFVGTVAKDPEVTIGASITGADGTVMTPVYTVNPSTGELKTTYITQPLKERVPSSGKPTEGSIARTAQQDMAAQLNSRRGNDGYVSPEDYKQARSVWISAGYAGSTFNDSFQYYANPANPQDYGLPIPE